MPIIPTMPIAKVIENTIIYIQPYDVKDHMNKETLYWDDPEKGLVPITDPELEELSKTTEFIHF